MRSSTVTGGWSTNRRGRTWGTGSSRSPPGRGTSSREPTRWEEAPVREAANGGRPAGTRSTVITRQRQRQRQRQRDARVSPPAGRRLQYRVMLLKELIDAL